MAHVSSSTEGYFVMADDFTGTKADFLAGPFSSEGQAQNALTTMETVRTRIQPTFAGTPTASMAYPVLVGQCESWANELERIKRQQFEPQAFIVGNHGAKDAWLQLDRIVCLMREAKDIFDNIYPSSS